MIYGFGSPVVHIYSDGKQLDYKVVDFVYKFSEKEDDTCQMRIIDSYNPNLADDPAFQEGSILTVTWGYIGGEMSDPRKIAIRDIIPSFTDTEVALELLCTDVAARIKIGAKKKVHKKVSVDDLAKAVAEENGLKYYNLINIDERGIRRPGYEWQGLDNGIAYVDAIDNTVSPISLKVYDSIVQANQTDHQVLKDKLEETEGGPYDLVGRDDTLTIQKLHLGGSPLKVFTFGGSQGELISFTPETRSRTRKSEATEINLNINDPENKSSGNLSANNSNSSVDPMGSVVDSNDDDGVNPTYMGLSGDAYKGLTLPSLDITTASKKEANENGYAWGKEGPSRNESVNSLVGQFTKPLPTIDGGSPLPNREINTGIISSKQVVPFRGIDNSMINGDGPDINADFNIPAVGESTATTFIRPKYGKIIEAETETKEEAAAKAQNKQARAALEKNPAEALVVGNPKYLSGKLYGFKNTSHKYSGNYYAIEATHTLDVSGGYKVEFSLHRNAENSPNGAVGPTKVKAKANNTPSLIKVKATPSLKDLEKAQDSTNPLLNTIRVKNLEDGGKPFTPTENYSNIVIITR